MSRPDYPEGILTPGIIRAVREEQAAYDRDPDAYEAERQREEDWEREQEEALREECERNMNP